VRSRDRVLQSLEKVYKSAFAQAEEKQDSERMTALDLEYQRDQIQLEVLLDLRALLLPDEPTDEADPGGSVRGILDTAAKLRNLTRLR